MKNLIFLLCFSLPIIASKINAQYGISGGVALIKPFGVPELYPGLHMQIEFNENDTQTFYGRFTFAPGQKVKDEEGVFLEAKDINTSPYVLQVPTFEKLNYSVLEFGKRYYFGEGYESGFGIYGGTNMAINFNKVRYELDDYDKSLYKESTDNSNVGTIIGLGFGLNGGVKNSFNFGTLYFDAGLNYTIYAIPSKNLVKTPANYSQLYFAFNIGFRKNIY